MMMKKSENSLHPRHLILKGTKNTNTGEKKSYINEDTERNKHAIKIKARFVNKLVLDGLIAIHWSLGRSLSLANGLMRETQ